MEQVNLNGIKRLEIKVGGRVQGVFFRVSAKKVADECGLTGFARNTKENEVEIVAEGGVASLRRLLDWCYKGPLLANVDALSYKWLPFVGEFENFEVERVGNNYFKDKIEAVKNLGKSIVKDKLAHPKHVVIIPDGNRRWAKEQDRPTWHGHKEGIARFTEIVESLDKSDVTNLTFWGFSTENWERAGEEVSYIMNAVKEATLRLRAKLFEKQIGFRHFGRKDRLPKDLLDVFDNLERDTVKFTNKQVAIALDYGGRDEILRAIDKLPAGTELNEQAMSKAMDTYGFPDPDLIIRTSGEHRLSGMMPWQGVYAELFFSPLYFPDFTPVEFALALDDYALRKRRFGK